MPLFQSTFGTLYRKAPCPLLFLSLRRRVALLFGLRFREIFALLGVAVVTIARIKVFAGRQVDPDLPFVGLVVPQTALFFRD